MIKETMYCDRCGRECEHSRMNRGFHIFRNKFFVRESNDEYLDLCQACYDGLAKWIKKRQNIGG